MADCKAFREELEDSADASGLSLEARAHAGACPSCGEFGRERDALRRLVVGLGRVEAPADFEFRLRARMRVAKNGGGKYNLLGSRLAPGLAWAAAVAFVVVSASLYLWHGRTNPSGPRQASRVNEPARETPAVGTESRTAENDLAMREEKKVDVPFVEVAGNKSVDNPRRTISRRPFREAARRGLETAATFGSSAEFSQTGARILTVKIPPRTSPESLRFIVRDERGNTRSVPMRAVSFGSQEMVAGANERARMAATDKGGVW